MSPLAEHARSHGISPDYALPRQGDRHDDGRHDDDDIQTLLLPETLQRIGRSLHGRGHAFERETGVNVLHAAFGILEWNEPGSSRKPAASPLLLLEIRMERRKTSRRHRISHLRRGRDRAEHHARPDALDGSSACKLPPFDGGSIEAYLDGRRGSGTDILALERAPRGAPRRLPLLADRHVSRPRPRSPADRGTPARRPALLGSVSGGASSYAPVYDTDAPEIEACVPHLVMDADASQFSALVDVARGENLAIEGPPGSGKSQTIVNMIARRHGRRQEGPLRGREADRARRGAQPPRQHRASAISSCPCRPGKGSREAVFQSLEDRLEMERPRPGRRRGATRRARRRSRRAAPRCRPISTCWAARSAPAA